MPDPFTDPTPAELEMLNDTAHQAEHGRPMKRPAVQGIADMQARIELLTGQKRRLLDQMAGRMAKDERLSDEAALADLNKDLREAEDRLREYQVQHEGRN
jgi:hypothetical protein